MASDGTVTIKVQANDKDLNKLVKSVQNLAKQLDSLPSNPFDGIARGAVRAKDALFGVSDGSDEVSRSLDRIDSSNVDDVSNSANKADSELEQLSFTADEVDSSVNSIDSDALDALGTSADRADADLEGLSFTAQDVDSNISNIDSRAIESVGNSADQADGNLFALSHSANDVAKEIDNVDASSVEDVGRSADRSSSEMDEMGNSAGQAAKEINEIDARPIENTEKSSRKLNTSFMELLKTVGVVKLVSVGFDMLTGSIDGAIDRFDTFNTFPRTMQGLGYSVEQADRAIRRLDEGTRGLPTTLDGIVRNTQRIAAVTGDLNLATETALALNNAFLASGSSAADAARGTEQYVQMLSKGEADLQSYRTLQETMTLALNKTAESFGFAGESAQTDFYAALKSGEITFREFNARLIEMSEAQGGFADLAQTNSESLRTSWTNLRTAFVRNTANIISKLDELSYALTGNSIAQNVDRLQKVVNTAFGAIGTAIDMVSPIVIASADAFRMLYQATEPLHPLFIATAAGIGAMIILAKVQTWLSGTTIGIAAYTFATEKMNAATLANIAVQKYNLIWAKAATTQFSVLSAAMGAKTLAIGAATKAWGLLSGAITFLTGPVGWVIGAIGAVAGGLVYLWRTIGQASEEMVELTEDIDDASDATRSLADSIDTASESYATSQARMEGQTNSIKTLMAETERLSKQERLSAADKKLLQDNIEELNSSVEGLSLAYDEEQGRLTASNEAMEARLRMMEEEEKMAGAQERLREISEQRAEATAQLEENSRKLNEAQEMLDESGTNWFGKNNDLKESVEELKEENENLKNGLTELGEEEERVNAQRTESAEAYAEAQEVANNQVVTSLEQLSDKQREVAESIQSEYQGLVAAARDWSNEIETEYTKVNADGEEYVASSKEVFEDHKRVLENNVEAMREWSENMEALSERGIDDGLLEQLRQMGPEGLPLVEGFVNASDEELREMEGLFSEAAELSKEGLMNGLAIEEGSIIEGADGLIFNTGETMIEAVERSGLADIVPNALQESETDMVEAGRNVAEGAARGIEEGSARASAASGDMASDINEAFATELAIHSPSRKFKQHGSDIVAGLLAGWNQEKPKMLQAVTKFATELSKTFSDSIKDINSNSLSGWKSLTDTITKQLKDANNSVKTELTSMSQQLQTSNNQMNQVALQGTTQMTRTYQQSYREINSIVTREQRNMVQTTTQNVRLQQQITQNGYRAMRNMVQNEMNGVVNVTRTAMSQSVAIMQNTASQARLAGQNMGLGFRNGLAGTAGSIQATARNLANSAASTIQRALRINSPSRVTMALGEYTGDGLVEGMKHRLRDVEQIAGEMAQKALPQIDVGRTLGLVGGTHAAASIVNNNQSYTLNANGSSGTSGLSRDEMERIFKEFIWYIQQGEGGALDG
jgi:tape measure domain-containing protein